VLAYVGKEPSGDYEPFVFGTGFSAHDVEISDDTFIVSRETAESYKARKEKPPTLTLLAVSPATAQVQPGKKQAFIAKGLDQHGRDIATGQVDWKASGGVIDSDGVFSAGDDEGNFVVSVSVGTVKGSATISVAKAGSTAAPTPQKPPASQGSLRWTGEIPPQKWMNFYTKVLSKVVGRQGLKLTLNVEVSPESGVSPQKIEETRVALQELGLNDDVSAD
jgi:hypothetical protein